MKRETIRRRYAIHYFNLPDGSCEAAIWNRTTNEPVWVEAFPNRAAAREAAEAEMEDIIDYVLARRVR